MTIDNVLTNLADTIVTKDAEIERLRGERDIAVEFLRAYREQGAPGRIGRVMLDEFLAGLADRERGEGT